MKHKLLTNIAVNFARYNGDDITAKDIAVAIFPDKPFKNSRQILNRWQTRGGNIPERAVSILCEMTGLQRADVLRAV